MRRSRVLSLTLCTLALAGAVLAGRAQSADGIAPQSGNGRLSMEQAKALKSPVKFTKESISKGRILFSRNCTTCHGPDGKARVDVVANATDLTDPKFWQSGTSEGEIFRSIRDGAGESMPAFKPQFHDEQDIWHLVNYIRSMWPDAARPKLEEGPSSGGKT